MSRTLAIIVDGVVDNIIIGNPDDFPGADDVTDVDPQPAPGWARIAVGQYERPAPAPAAEARKVTRLAFRNRFTQAELVTLEIAALDDPSAPMAARQQAASIRVMMASLAAATFIDLDRPDTRGGVQQLEAAGLIAAGRGTAILDTPIESHEVPVQA